MNWRSLLGRRDAEPTVAEPVVPAAATVAPERDGEGRFLSAHRRAVYAKCREQCAALGREVPEALR